MTGVVLRKLTIAAVGVILVLLVHSGHILHSDHRGGNAGLGFSFESNKYIWGGGGGQSNMPPEQMYTPMATYAEQQQDNITADPEATGVGDAATASDEARTMLVKSQLGDQPFRPSSKHESFCKGGGSKCLPNFWFIGASKCGTTTMAKLLAKHPKIKFVMGGNEAHVFDIWDTGDFTVDAAKSRLRKAADALQSSGKNPRNYRIVEYTPHYLYDPQVAYRLRRTMGEERSKHMKFLVMLREPTARAFSSWVMKKNMKGSARDKRSFHQAVLDGIAHWDKRKRCTGKARRQGSQSQQKIYSDTCSPSLGHANPLHAHVEKSMYAPQLEVWLSLFPRENFFFLQLEDFTQDPAFWVQQVIEFMGLEPFGDLGFKSEDHIRSFVEDNGRRNTAKENLEISEEDMFLLNGLFRPFNAELDKMLGWETGYHGA